MGKVINIKDAKRKVYSLGIFERISLPSVLPDKANIEKAIICEDIREKIKLTQKDIERVKLQTFADGRMTWDDKKDKKIKVVFSDLELELIKSGFQKMNSENLIPTQRSFVEMYKMFNEV